MDDSLFRKLTATEEKEFRDWARTNYQPGSPIDEVWHPATRNECALMNAEVVLPGSTLDLERQRVAVAEKALRRDSFKSIGTMDYLLACCAAVCVNPNALVAYYHAKQMPIDAEEQRRELGADADPEYNQWSELENQRDAELDGSHDFVQYYFDDVGEAMLFIQENTK